MVCKVRIIAYTCQRNVHMFVCMCVCRDQTQAECYDQPSGEPVNGTAAAVYASYLAVCDDKVPRNNIPQQKAFCIQPFRCLF